MGRHEDIDYLYASTRIRALEKQLITKDKFRRLAEARADEEIFKILSDCGYGEITSEKDVLPALARRRSEMFDTMMKISPDKLIVQFFLVKYDYHNIKALIKGIAAGTDYTPSLIDVGRIPLGKIVSAVVEGNSVELPSIARAAAAEAADILARTGDPRLADSCLDRAMFAEMREIADKTDIKFLKEYVKLYIDSINLRIALRLKRVREDGMQMMKYYIPGGTVSEKKLSGDMGPETMISVFEPTALRETAQLAASAIRREIGLSPVDNAAENALLDYLKNAKCVAFGEAPVIAYIAAVEAETNAVHTVMAGRRAGISPDEIMQKLRDTYV